MGFQAGVRESAQSWRELLACLRGRGLTIGPELAIGDGALGFWKALEEIFPDTRRQRCWVHKTANVLNKLPKSRQTAAKAALHDIWMADGRAEAERAMNTFAAKYDAKYLQAVACLTKDRDALLAFYDFPAEHWRHIRTTNPIESVFATVRHRTVRTKGCLSHGDNSGHGLQADHHRQQDLAAAHGKQSVAQGHRRCEIQRRCADRRNQNSRRRLITPSPKIGHTSRPHRVRHFKLSTDPEFVTKLRDIVGLYVDPPAHAVVLSVDEKSQIQALDRTQPGLPLKKGRCGTITHDYKRNGTTTLFAALDVLEGKVIGRCMQRHRHQEFIRFLNAIEAEVPAGKIVHVILDNYGTHKHPKVVAWLERHPRFVFHFTPTSCSWLNAVETFFAKLSKRRLKRGVFHSIVNLQTAINRFIAETNDDPTPFVWTANPNKIVAAVKRGHQALDSIH